MRLRNLVEKDAPLMLEWMHDGGVVENLHTDFGTKTLADCLHFIEEAQDMKDSIHMAIVDSDDEYMGTVSLKHITGNAAEFAIAVRKSAMGRGFSKFAMTEMIHMGLKEKGLERIYWCVSPKNTRALRFYDKNGYGRIMLKDRKIEGYNEDETGYYVWYEVLRKHLI